VPGQSVGLPPASATELAVTIRNTELRNLLLDSLLILGVVMLLALVAGWWLSGRVLRPVHQLTIAARTASDGQLDRRLNLTGPRTNSKNSPTPSTTCLTDSRRPSKPNDGSWPTPATNCAAHSR
jgi:methyl-accepting chemotaxis protein